MFATIVVAVCSPIASTWISRRAGSLAAAPPLSRPILRVVKSPQYVMQ
jgi:hypothetical protein